MDTRDRTGFGDLINQDIRGCIEKTLVSSRVRSMGPVLGPSHSPECVKPCVFVCVFLWSLRLWSLHIIGLWSLHVITPVAFEANPATTSQKVGLGLLQKGLCTRHGAFQGLGGATCQNHGKVGKNWGSEAGKHPLKTQVMTVVNRGVKMIEDDSCVMLCVCASGSGHVGTEANMLPAVLSSHSQFH